MKTVLISIALVVICMMQYGEAAITEWTTPDIDAAASGTGTLSVAEDQALNTAIETYVAVSGATLGDYTLVTAVSPFALSTGGVLTITAALDYETTTTYTFEIQVVDDANPVGSGTATITVTVADVNEAPSFAATSYAKMIADASTAGTTLTTVTATDPDAGDTITYSIADGDANNHFTIGTSTGIITVNTGITLAASTTAGYALQVEAADNDGTSLTGTTTVIVYVGSCSGSAALFASSVMVLLTIFVAILKQV